MNSAWQFVITDENRGELLALIRDAPAGWRLALAGPAHTTLQRKKFNAMARDIAGQVQIAGEHLTQKEMKEWLVAAWRQQKMLPGDARGTIVFVGEGLGKKSIPEVSELIELAYAFGSERGVKWSKEAQQETEPE